MEGEKLLRRKPVIDDLSNAMADEESGFGLLDWRDEDGIQGMGSALNFVARDLHALDLLNLAKTPQDPVAQGERSADKRNRKAEDESLHTQNVDWCGDSNITF